MVCYFIGGALGSILAGIIYGAHGWSGVCLLGAGFGLLTCAMTVYDRVRPPQDHQVPVPSLS
jgi:MFS family permease